MIRQTVSNLIAIFQVLIRKKLSSIIKQCWNLLIGLGDEKKPFTRTKAYQSINSEYESFIAEYKKNKNCYKVTSNSKKTKLTEIVLLTRTYNLQDLKDWLHWHLDIIGFDCVHIFDNESLVDIKPLCDNYGSRVTYEKIKGFPDQYALYNRYINNESPAWWVLPIDDDEFVYIGKQFNHNVSELLLSLSDKWQDMVKLSIGWRNMFPVEFTQIRTKSLIENATGWSDEVCSELQSIWRQDNRWIKTFVKTSFPWYWGIPYNSGHNPTMNNGFLINARTIDGRFLSQDYAKSYINNDNLFIAHFQYKSNEEWIMKCKNRPSPANKTFNKNKPEVYSKLYEYKDRFKTFDGLAKLWSIRQ
ncbi:hypothetical protein IKQ19_20925 [Candidatus Saccharibacteria bacterium]|nr:hypothetical protein [Candidatus Saccharibacteria bacterium]MBR6126020.1 hypothetical protein [Candidatus Saccharibacteria bacterium]